MIVFTKTCARDANVLYYQVRAVRRHIDSAAHIVVVERNEAAPVREVTKDVDGVIVVECGDMGIADPYLRQQMLKLSMGGDALQLDSDMIPERRVVNPARKIWNYALVDDMPQGTQARWRTHYLPVDEKLWGTRSPAAFMVAGAGWYINWHLWAVSLGKLERHRDWVSKAEGFSEYHFLGRCIEEFQLTEYKMQHVDDGVVYPEVWTTSGRVPTTNVTRARLAKAAGVSI